MSSPGFPGTAVHAERCHGITRRGLRPALDAVFPLLLAITDDERAASVISVTRELVRARGAVPTVLRALGSNRETEAPLQPFIGYVAQESLSPEYRDEAIEMVRRQVADVVGDVRWQFEVADEAPVEAIVNRARQLRAGLILIGLRRHNVIHRVVAGDLLRSIVRLTGAPVLAVRPHLVALPRRVAVAVDFGEASVRAANIARHILADDGEMHLVHVLTDSTHQYRAPASLRGADAFTCAMRDLASMIDDLRPARGMRITAHVIDGETEATINGFAERVQADLLAVGSDEHPLFERLVNKSVSMGLARTAHRSMLVVPARGRADDPTAAHEQSVT